jgi:hypothetical protein
MVVPRPLRARVRKLPLPLPLLRDRAPAVPTGCGKLRRELLRAPALARSPRSSSIPLPLPRELGACRVSGWPDGVAQWARGLLARVGRAGA